MVDIVSISRAATDITLIVVNMGLIAARDSVVLGVALVEDGRGGWRRWR